MTDEAVCSRCRRPAPPELEGPPDARSDDWAAWEIVSGDGVDMLVCPGCVTREERHDIPRGLDDDAR